MIFEFWNPRVEWTTTSTLLRDLRDFQNQDAWNHFAARFRRPLVSFARRLGLNDIDAEDAAQETLVAFATGFRGGGYDREKGRLSRWLFGIAYRQCLQTRRARGRPDAAGAIDPHSALFGALEDEASASQVFDQTWEQSLLADCIERARGEVEETTFRAFELVVREGHTAESAAKTLGIPVKSIYNAKHRLLKRIRELRRALDDA